MLTSSHFWHGSEAVVPAAWSLMKICALLDAESVCVESQVTQTGTLLEPHDCTHRPIGTSMQHEAVSVCVYLVYVMTRLFETRNS